MDDLFTTPALSAVFSQAALEDARVRAILSPEEIKRVLDPGTYLGNARVFIDRALASYCEVQLMEGVGL